MSTRSSAIALDTNILVYARFGGDPRHGPACEAIMTALRRDRAVLTTQVLAEYYRVVTSTKVTRPLAPAEAAADLHRFGRDRRVRILPVRPRTILAAAELVESCGVRGSGIYDAVLAATLIEAGVATLFSENVRDFLPYTALKVVDPLR